MPAYPHDRISGCPHVRMSACPHIRFPRHVRASACPHVRMSAYPHVRMSSYPHILVLAYSHIRLCACPHMRILLYRDCKRILQDGRCNADLEYEYCYADIATRTLLQRALPSQCRLTTPSQLQPHLTMTIKPIGCSQQPPANSQPASAATQ